MTDAGDGDGRPAGGGGWSTMEWTPVRVTALYLVLGFLALVVSDLLIVAVLDDPLLSNVQSAKGAIEILATAGFIFVLTRRSRRQLRRTNNELERQREELSVLHRVLRHDLRNALTVIAGAATHLRSKRELDSEAMDHCTRIERRAERLADVVEQASQIRRITENGNDGSVLDLEATIHAAVRSVDTTDASVSVDVPSNEKIVVNRLFEAAIAELVDNAISHAETARPTVDIRGSRNAEWITIRISDDGPGFPDRVRRVFARREFDQLLHLEGMGLWFAYWTVSDAGGTFRIESNEAGGTTIVLSVRRA